MKNKYISTILISLIVIFIPVISIITPDKITSELEGRELQFIPTLTNMNDNGYNFKAYIYSALTGTLFKKWDDYFSDSIYLREPMVNSYMDIQKAFNKKYVNNAFIGTDNMIFLENKEYKLDEIEVKNLANKFNKISERFKKSQIYMVNIPTKNIINKDLHPINNYIDKDNYYINDFFKYINKDLINLIDLSKDFYGKDDLYYKTDHHWNMNGVYKGYVKIINDISEKNPEVGLSYAKEEFKIGEYKNCFNGSGGRKVSKCIDFLDDISIYEHKNLEQYVTYINEEKGTLFNVEKISKKKFNDDYMVYLGGDNSYVKIQNKEWNDKPNILMIGDSMDNPLITIMTPHFNTIHSFDLRHFNGDIIKEIDKIQPDILMYIGQTTSYLNKNHNIFNWE